MGVPFLAYPKGTISAVFITNKLTIMTEKKMFYMVGTNFCKRLMINFLKIPQNSIVLLKLNDKYSFICE